MDIKIELYNWSIQRDTILCMQIVYSKNRNSRQLWKLLNVQPTITHLGTSTEILWTTFSSKTPQLSQHHHTANRTFWKVSRKIRVQTENALQSKNSLVSSLNHCLHGLLACCWSCIHYPAGTIQEARHKSTGGHISTGGPISTGGLPNT